MKKGSAQAWMERSFILQGMRNPHQTVVWGMWAGDYRESKLEVLGYLSDDMKILVSYEMDDKFPIGCYVAQKN